MEPLARFGRPRWLEMSPALPPGGSWQLARHGGPEKSYAISQGLLRTVFQREIKVESQAHVVILPVWLLARVIFELIVQVEFDALSYRE